MNTTTKFPSCRLHVVSPTDFWVDNTPEDGDGTEEFFNFGPYHVPDTSDMPQVHDVLAKVGWDELELNAAVYVLNHDPDEKRRNWRRERIAQFGLERDVL